MLLHYFYILLFAAAAIAGCANVEPLPDEHPSVFLSLTDAEKILGETAHLSDSSLVTEKGVRQYKLTYTANATDTGSGKTGNIYFMAEVYEDAASAHKTYASIFKSNEDHEGVVVLDNLGDEAYFHSDSNPQNFMFIMVRKGAKMIRMKVNKVTAKTSQNSLNEIITALTSKL
ncbi:MAG: hypothetical protein R3C61_20675 [Bacteroidia bacterium]